MITRITNKQHWEGYLAQDNPPDIYIIDFTASWCGPCRVIHPQYEKLSLAYNEKSINFLEIDVDQAGELASIYGVSAMPTFVLTDNRGVQLDRSMGADINSVRKMIDWYLIEENRLEAISEVEKNFINMPSSSLSEKLTVKSDKTKMILFMIVLTLCLYSVYQMDPIYQNNEFYDFADKKSLNFGGFKILNYANVISNVIFLLSSIYLLRFLAKNSTVYKDSLKFLFLRQPIIDDESLEVISRTKFIRGDWRYFRHQERRWLPTLAIGLFFTALGSAYFHWNPNASTLVWDRAPMTLAFVPITVEMIAEFVSYNFASASFVPLVLIALGSVFKWRYDDLVTNGLGDLRLYYTFQFILYPISLLSLTLFKSKYTYQTQTYTSLMCFYALAKYCEANDKSIYIYTGEFISGHTLKHLFAGIGLLFYFYYIKHRTLIQPKPKPKTN